MPSRKRRTRKSKAKAAASKISTASNVDALLRETELLAQRGDVDAVIERLEVSIKQGVKDTRVLDELALAYMHASRSDDAEGALRESIKLAPNAGHEKYGYLSQLLGNTEEALALAQQGIELLKEEYSRLQSADASEPFRENSGEELQDYLISALCSYAEICLGFIEDSNDEGIAHEYDAKIEVAIKEALAFCRPGTPAEIEALLSVANVRLSQGKKDEAKMGMLRILQRLNPSLGKMEKAVAEGNQEALANAHSELPPMEMKIAIGKQLMEVDMWREAGNLLEAVLFECDFNVEVWYMLAIIHWKLNEVEKARETLERTRRVLNNSKGCDGHLDNEMIDNLYSELDKVNEGNTETRMCD